jgi:hypothetical protein
MATEAIIAQQIVDSTTDSRTIIVGSGMVWDDTNKRLGINTPSPSAALHVTPLTTASVGVQITAKSGQSADLLRWQDSLGNTIGRVASNGNLHVSSITRQGVASTSVTLNGPWQFTQAGNAEGVFIFGESGGTAAFLRTRNFAGNRRCEIDAGCDIRVFGAYTNASNYVRASLTCGTTSARLSAETAGNGADDVDLELYPAGIGGVKIASASTQKIGLWGTAPVAQPAAVADATSEADAVTKLNDLLAKLRTIGIIGT